MPTRLILSLGIATIVVAILSQIVTAQSDLWRDTAPPTARGSEIERGIVPQEARVMTADLTALDAILASAPLESDVRVSESPVQLTLPLPDGGFAAFRIVASPLLPPELAARYPQITTYLAQGVDNPALGGRLDRTQRGFHAYVTDGSASIYIDPYSRDNASLYNVYFASNFSRTAEQILPQLPPVVVDRPEDLSTSSERGATAARSGDVLSIYRLALASTGEYSQFHGGNKPDVMAEMTTAINRVNVIFERDVAVRLVFIPNNDDLIFLNASTDGYTNNSGSAMLNENQSTIDAIIDSANYDIGHVFSTGGGGVAALISVCYDLIKAQGVTGLPAPQGDPFYIDYVAHEIGHQFGGEHTFNTLSGFCGSLNQYSASSSYEPGSGTTIMAYAGICAPDNVQFNSDPIFHSHSYDQIRAYVTDTRPTYGGDCPVLVNTGNTPPTVNAGTGGVTIPLNTPFVLTGSASDPNGDPLIYSWEQYDLGPAGSPNNPSGNAPLFRAFEPTNSPTRTFPQISDIINNTQTLGEILPTYARNLTFRLIARDQAAGGGGLDYDSITISVTDQAGPFRVTTPSGGESYNGSIPVVWDVASTNLSPVGCSSVDITLSTDGGLTYPVTLASATANDGSETVPVPNGVTSAAARARVECALNNTVTFFDISDNDFSVVGGGTARGDCNASGTLTNADLTSLRLELFDGDGINATNAASGSYTGDPIGCDANADSMIDGGDLSCTALLLNGGSCTP